MTLWDGAGALGSMRLVMAGAVIGIPVVLVFNILAYRSVFGKERPPVPLLPPPSPLTRGAELCAALAARHAQARRLGAALAF